MNDSDRKRIFDLKQLCEKVNKSPGRYINSMEPDTDLYYDVELLNTSRTAIPWLLELTEKQAEKIKWLEGVLDIYQKHAHYKDIDK